MTAPWQPCLRGGEALLSHSEPCMGTMFTIRAYHADETQGYAAIGKAFQRAHALDATLSDYRPSNELDVLCQQGHTKPFHASPDLFAVLAHALRVSHDTNGAFDVSLGPLTRLWRAARKEQRIPEPAEIADARAHTGWRGIALDETRGTIQLPRAGMQLDFGAIAKGYAADAVRMVLREHGITRAFVAAGGDVVVLQPPPERQAWHVALETGESPQATLRLAAQAVSTSGDLHQFVEINGRRYSHVLDPATGMGLTTRSIVSVVAADATECDSFSTALSVMGLKKAKQFLTTRKGMEARFVRLSADSADVWMTPGFPLA